MPVTRLHRPLVITAALLLGLALAAPAQAMRCGSKIVREGDDALRVLAICGEPDLASQREHLRSARRWDYWRHAWLAVEELVVVEYWIYDRGPRRLKRRVVLENGEVKRIETLRYGN